MYLTLIGLISLNLYVLKKTEYDQWNHRSLKCLMSRLVLPLMTNAIVAVAMPRYLIVVTCGVGLLNTIVSVGSEYLKGDVGDTINYYSKEFVDGHAYSLISYILILHFFYPLN